MKSIISIFIFFILFATNVCYAVSTSTTDVSIDWDNMEVIGNYVVYESFSGSQSIVSPPMTNFDIDNKFGENEDGITTTYSQSQNFDSFGFMISLASTDDDIIGSSNIISINNSVVGNYLAESRANRSVTLEVLNETNLNIYIPYDMEIEVKSRGDIIDLYSRVWFFMSRCENNDWITMFYDEQLIDSVVTDDYYDNNSDILSYSFSLDPGYYQIDLGVDSRIYTEAVPTPIPTSIVLLGCGLVGLFYRKNN